MLKKGKRLAFTDTLFTGTEKLKSKTGKAKSADTKNYQHIEIYEFSCHEGHAT